MKSYLAAIVLFCAVKAIAELFFKKGAASPLASSMRLVLSLVIIASICAPIVFIFQKGSFSLPPSPSVPEGESLLVDRFREKMESDVREAFGTTDVSLTVECDEDEIPTRIIVQTSDEETGKRIADYILLRYRLQAAREERSES